MKARQLLSRYIRSNLAAGKTGRDVLHFQQDGNGRRLPAAKSAIRKIASLVRLDKGGEKLALPGPIKAIWDGVSWIANQGAKFIGFAAGKVLGWIGFSATKIWATVVSAANQLWRFNWNASDEELRNAIGDMNLRLASLWGGVVGSGLGWIAGIGIGYGVSFLCPVIGGAALARTIAAGTAKEAIDELLPQVSNALAQTAGMFARSGLINFYINYRKMLKNAPLPLLEKVYGKERAYFIRNEWGNKGGPNMSFSTQVEEKVESIENKYVKAFVEELLEESWDSFTEAGFVVAQQIDDAYAQQKLQNDKTFGEERSVILEPNRELSSEKLSFIQMPQNLLIPAVQQTINTHRLIHNRDVGMVIGLPEQEYVKIQPHNLRIIIQFFSVKQPPFYPGGKVKIVRVQVAIPDLKRSALDWNKIKVACGGANGYLWGRFKAVASLSNGRPLICYAASEKEAEERINGFLALSSATLQTLDIIEEKKTGERLKKPKLYKESTRIYPAYFTILNREAVLDPNRGRTTTEQKYLDRRGRIDLWTQAKPPNCEETIRRLLEKST